MRDIIKIINDRERNINPYYDIRVKEGIFLSELANQDVFDAISKAFIFGYEMGVRATKAERKMKAKA